MNALRMNMSRKTIVLAVIAIAVLALAAGSIYLYRHPWRNPDPDTAAGVEPLPADTGEASSTPTSTQNPKPAAAGVRPAVKPKLVNDVTAPSLTYSQAAAIFANTLIAFNENCNMVPNPVLVKSGTTIMFDNRYREARTFKLDGTSYTIPGYGFKLFQLSSTKLPHVVRVECASNTGEITLQ